VQKGWHRALQGIFCIRDPVQAAAGGLGEGGLGELAIPA